MPAQPSTSNFSWTLSKTFLCRCAGTVRQKTSTEQGASLPFLEWKFLISKSCKNNRGTHQKSSEEWHQKLSTKQIRTVFSSPLLCCNFWAGHLGTAIFVLISACFIRRKMKQKENVQLNKSNVFSTVFLFYVTSSSKFWLPFYNFSECIYRSVVGDNEAQSLAFDSFEGAGQILFTIKLFTVFGYCRHF